jgi:hypothetical protein
MSFSSSCEREDWLEVMSVVTVRMDPCLLCCRGPLSLRLEGMVDKSDIVFASLDATNWQGLEPHYLRGKKDYIPWTGRTVPRLHVTGIEVRKVALAPQTVAEAALKEKLRWPGGLAGAFALAKIEKAAIAQVLSWVTEA